MIADVLGGRDHCRHRTTNAMTTLHKIVLTCLLMLIGTWIWSILASMGVAPPGPGMVAPPPALPKATDAQLAEAKRLFEYRWRQTERAVATVRLEPLNQDDLLVSKVGGAPYLEIGDELPHTRSGKPMVLLAQINFAELPPMPDYPERGIVQFFISASLSDNDLYGMTVGDYSVANRMKQTDFRVRYVAEPNADPGRWQVAPAPDTGGQTPHEPNIPRRMRFTAGQEAITPRDSGFKRAVGFDPQTWVESQSEKIGVDLEDFAERILPSGAGHKIGGYPFFTQTDPRAPDSTLRLLLQLDTDDQMMWGDSGIGGFFIDPDDLRRADFSRVLYHWDCH